MDCDDPDGDDNPDEEYDYPYEADDSQEQDQDPQDDGQDADDDCHWGGSEQHSQGQPEEGASMVKAILTQMRRLAEENDK